MLQPTNFYRREEMENIFRKRKECQIICDKADTCPRYGQRGELCYIDGIIPMNYTLCDHFDEKSMNK
jgi:hypothetical protein